MELLDTVLSPASIYNMLFFNIKAVLEYPSLEALRYNNAPMAYRWEQISDKKYIKDSGMTHEGTYLKFAPEYPEYTKIVAITYANVYSEDGKLKRYFKSLKSNDETQVISMFMDVLHQKSSEGQQSMPQNFESFCGYDIMGYELPLLVKRFVLNVDKLDNQKLPYIIKKHMSAKPWDSAIVDAVTAWKFTGHNASSIMLISDFLGLKTTAEIFSLEELSKYYWDNIGTDEDSTIEFIENQSANHTNLVIQLMNRLRKIG